MLRVSMLLSYILMTNSASVEDTNLPPTTGNTIDKRELSSGSASFTSSSGGTGSAADFDKYAVTCYICVNVSDNLICNQYAIDRPCKPGETFCHTLHIMDSKGTSVLVNKKCTTDKECQRTKVGCVEIDSQTMCVSCCDHNYCNMNAPVNSSNAVFDDKITKMRMLAKNLFREQEKAMTTIIKETNSASSYAISNVLLSLLIGLIITPLPSNVVMTKRLTLFIFCTCYTYYNC